MNKKYCVCLTPAERLFLENNCRNGTHNSRKIRRAQVLLKCDTGLTDEKIASNVNISIRSIERIRKRFCTKGLTTALEERPRSGAPTKVDLRVETEVVALVCSSPPNGYKRWTYDMTIGEIR